MDERPLLALTTLGEAMLRGAAIAAVMIATVVGLYLLKNTAGSQGWRVRVSRGVQRMFTFAVWLVVKKVPWKPILIWGPWVVMIGGLAFYRIENWRGKRAWAAMELRLAEEREKFRREENGRRAIPDEENYLAHPAVVAEWSGVYGDTLKTIRHIGSMGPGIAFARSRDDIWMSGRRENVRDWLTSPIPAPGTEEAAAVMILQFLESQEPRLAAVAEAAGRPHCQVSVKDRGRDEIEEQSRMAQWRLAQLHDLFAERAVLRIRALDFDGAYEDLRTCVQLTGHARQNRSEMGFSVWTSMLRTTEGVIWDTLHEADLDDATMAWVDEALREFDPLEGVMEPLRRARDQFLVALETTSRKQLHEWIEGSGCDFVDLLPPGSPPWMEERQAELNEWIMRAAPQGWVDLWKVRYCNFMNRSFFAPSGIPFERLAPDADLKYLAEHEQLGSNIGEEMISAKCRSGIHGIHEQALHAQARLDLLRIGIALERYRNANGSYPTKLAQLEPAYLDSLPDDLMSGEAYRYRIKPDGSPLVYSVGFDRVDDGGVPAKYGRVLRELDWVWQLTPTVGQSRLTWERGQKPKPAIPTSGWP